MHRFYVEERIEGIGHVATLSREESLHAARVLRLGEGDEVLLLDGEGLYAGELAQVNEQGVSVRVTRALPSPEPPVRVTLLQGLPKADKLEMIAQKATELGVWEIIPVEMERSVAKAGKAAKPDKSRNKEKADRPDRPKKLERCQRIALEAAKQSGRAHVPRVGEAIPFSEICQSLETKSGEPAYDAVLVAWEEEQSLPLSRAVRDFHAKAVAPGEGNEKPDRTLDNEMPDRADRAGRAARVALIIGPEGGITPEECARLKERGAVCVTLGPRILRTETAGLCGLSVIWAALGEM